MAKKLDGKQMVKKYWQRVEKKLLQIGGRTAKNPKADLELPRILREGHLHDGLRLRCPGKPQQCHRNSAEVWVQNHGQVRLCTGYALSGDVWFQHSWCFLTFNGESMILETTPVKWTTYYGFSLSEDEACRFFEANAWDNLQEEERDLFRQHYMADIDWLNSLINRINGEGT